MVEGAVTMLSHYMGDKQGAHRSDAENRSQIETSFVQKQKSVTCFSCGKKGHYANACTEAASDSDEASSANTQN